MLINIDNGGTLTDVCVIDGARIFRTKTLTTPYDLSKCFLDGLRKASVQIFGREDLVGLLNATDDIRYSTTQGTNALVERKGPRLGLIVTGSLGAADLRRAPGTAALYDVLVGERFLALDLSAKDVETAAVRAVSSLASSGANRLVVAHGGAGRHEHETRLKSLFLEKFPTHLLGAIPILYSHELVEDDDDVRRTWTALFNAFLHPAMERFLYNAEHQLRKSKARRPLLIFRNDGHSARVAKTVALKTYGSGPRGGMEGAKAAAAHHGFEHLVSMDVGGTTTDIGEVTGGGVRVDRHGHVEGVEVSYPLCNVTSVGVGGSSIFRVAGGKLAVGPESVGSAPGPACFGLGGKEATITDALVVSGLLDPRTFFGGELALDRTRAEAAVEANVGKPLGLGIPAAVAAMEQAWVDAIAKSIHAFTKVRPTTTLAAFGGAGPLLVCRVADAAGISRVFIPGLAAVFSAFGLGFSDVQHEAEAPIDGADLASARAEVEDRVTRDMHAEGFELADCVLDWSLRSVADGVEERMRFDGTVPPAANGRRLWLAVSARRPLPHPALEGRFGGDRTAARSGEARSVRIGDAIQALPVHRVEDQAKGASASGPCVLEEPFYTARIDAGWRFEIGAGGDVLLERTTTHRENAR